MTPAIGAVLFDMDGLLVDSEPVWYAVEVEVMARLGGGWSHEQQAACVGGPLGHTAEHMAALVGSDVDPRLVEGWLVEGMAERLAAGVTLLPGAPELLDALATAAVPCGLVSSSYRRLVDLVLDAVDRTGPAAGRSPASAAFAVSVAGDEVSHGKPHPEPYLVAAARLGVDPASCVVLEDSLTGVASAEAAGCVCVAVPDLVPIPATATRPVLASLAGVDVAWLASLPGRLAAG